MMFVSGEATLENGLFRHSFSHPCNCYVGLMSFHLPNINNRHHLENSIDITCDQIDSTFANPKRLLKRLCFDRVKNNGFFNRWEATIIDYKRVDSDDKFLTFHVNRTTTRKPVEFNSSVTNTKIYYTLAIKPITDGESRWTCI